MFQLPNAPLPEPAQFKTDHAKIKLVISNYTAAASLQQSYRQNRLVLLLDHKELVAHTDQLVATNSRLKRPRDTSDKAKPMKKPKVAAQKGTMSDPMEVDDDDVVPGSRTSSIPLGSSTSTASSSSALQSSSSRRIRCHRRLPVSVPRSRSSRPQSQQPLPHCVPT